jgi:hypothetical protein
VPKDAKGKALAEAKRSTGRLTTRLREDLETPDRMQRLDRARREVGAFERPQTALVTGKICLPDEAARAAIKVSAAGHDEESNYAEVVAIHDALHSLLGVLGGARA